MKMSGYRSYTREEIKEAQKEGKTIYTLDTGNSGEDDTLIAEKGESYQDVMAAVLYHHEIETLPDNWSLDIVDWDID